MEFIVRILVDDEVKAVPLKARSAHDALIEARRWLIYESKFKPQAEVRILGVHRPDQSADEEIRHSD